VIWVNHNIPRLKMESRTCAAPSDGGVPSVSPKADTRRYLWQIRPLSDPKPATSHQTWPAPLNAKEHIANLEQMVYDALSS
jgi:hypothetical protein